MKPQLIQVLEAEKSDSLPIMKDVRSFYQQAEIVYSLSHKKLMELANDAGAIYRMDGIVLINREIFDEYLEQFHEK